MTAKREKEEEGGEDEKRRGEMEMKCEVANGRDWGESCIMSFGYVFQ